MRPTHDYSGQGKALAAAQPARDGALSATPPVCNCEGFDERGFDYAQGAQCSRGYTHARELRRKVCMRSRA